MICRVVRKDNNYYPLIIAIYTFRIGEGGVVKRPFDRPLNKNARMPLRSRQA